jgi:hypothetical protein
MIQVRSAARLWAVALVATLTLLCNACYFSRSGDSDSRLYADRTMGQILFGWNARVLESQASPELLQVAPKPKLALLCSKMNTLLGPMRRYNGSDAGTVRYFIPARQGVTEVAEYNATAQFQKGPGTIHFSALKRNGKWQIMGFYVQADLAL